ncbi:Hypothetical predicted protein [Pelobates cultripes]|uniref:Uncharacterized protein n=1 Tax=Pelobates cultripes TaxID=61616 RepID=A0AAD1REK7_PELCU|nr:Hypothetical predicted protein [Pelobates cultripes]
MRPTSQPITGEAPTKYLIPHYTPPLDRGGDISPHPYSYHVPSESCSCVVSACKPIGDTSKMADATSTTILGGEVLLILQRLEALFNDFWSTLQHRQTLPEIVEAPEMTRQAPSHPAASARGLTCRRWRRPCRRILRRAKCRLAPQPLTSRICMKVYQGYGEVEGRQLQAHKLLLTSLALSLKTQATWDSDLPAMGIG